MRQQGTVKYLSPAIQNDLIATLASSLERQLIADIKNAPFYSIITDTTQDISKTDQLSQTIRYVHLLYDDDGRPKEIKIKETFLGFFHCKIQAADDLSKQIVQIVEDKTLSPENCRGQDYDGASCMSGINL